VPVRAGGPESGLGGRLGLRGLAPVVRHHRRGAVREAPLGGGVMPRKAKVYALDRLLPERFGSQADQGLALNIMGLNIPALSP